MCRRTMGGDCSRGEPGLGVGWSGDTTHRSAAPTPVDTTWWPERQGSGVGLGLPTLVGCLLAQWEVGRGLQQITYRSIVLQTAGGDCLA